MKIKYEIENGTIEARLSGKSDRDLFDEIARLITEKFNVRWTEKLNGFDQRYWDLEIEDVRLTLHLEHYLGISLFSVEDCNDKTQYQMQRIGDYLETQIP